MGDRCYLKLTLHGHIETPRQLVRIAKAIVAEGLLEEMGGDHVEDVYDCLAGFMDTLEGDPSPEFADSDCNYGNVDDLENTLQDCGMAYNVYHGAGGGYPAGIWSWDPNGGHHAATCDEDGNAIVQSYNLHKAASMEDPAAGMKYLRELIDDAAHAEGSKLPTFSMSDKVKRILARRVALKALKAA